MNLFELKNYSVTFSPEALTLKPFKEIWDNDRSKQKTQAIKELAYVFFMCDDQSDYVYELDEEKRSEDIIRALDLEQGWIIPQYIQEAMEFYLQMSETTSTKMLRSTRAAAERVSGFLDDIDPNERDKMGKPVWSLSQIVSAIEKVPKIIKALKHVEEEVLKEKDVAMQQGQRQQGVNDDTGI